MSIKSEHDELLEIALAEIMNIRIEGVIFNQDYLGYWGLLDSHVINIALSSFRNGIDNLLHAIDQHQYKKELINYHSRICLRLINNETVGLSADYLYNTLSNAIEDFKQESINYDILHNNKLVDMSKTEKILLLMHIYQDRLATSFVTTANEYANAQKPTKRRISI